MALHLAALDVELFLDLARDGVERLVHLVFEALVPFDLVEKRGRVRDGVRADLSAALTAALEAAGVRTTFR